MAPTSFRAMLGRLLRAEGQSRAAKAVEAFGWLILIEGSAVLFVPHFVASVLHLSPLAEQAANYFRLAGLLVSGLGMLYIASGRLNAEGFRVRLHAGPAAGPLGHGSPLVARHHSRASRADFSIQDFGSFLWTLNVWRAETSR
jgi:hypothetical protein